MILEKMKLRPEAAKGVAMQKLEAAIISDGYLQPKSGNAYFYLSLSDNKDLVQREKIPINELLDFLRSFVADILSPLDVKPCTGYPKVVLRMGTSKKGIYLPGVMLCTLKSELVTELYHKYYPFGRKLVPGSFTLTRLSLAWLFMFDGNSQWDNNGGDRIIVSLYTQGLDTNSVEILEHGLALLGVNTGRNHVKVQNGSGIIISVLADNTDCFMDLIEPHVVPPFYYKVKYRGSCPANLLARYRERRINRYGSKIKE